MALRLAGEGYAEGGVTEFLGLSDTPASYSGQGGKYAKVHTAENALEFDTPSGGGDMLKSIYDTDDDGIVDNAEKLEGSTKAEVQDHDPKAHAPSHQDVGADEINVAGLSGELADLQKPKDHTHQSSGGGAGGKLDHGLALEGLGDDDHSQYLLADGSREASKIIITDGAGHYLQVPQLTTAQRDALTPANGMIIYNTTTNQFERYENGAWGAFGGGELNIFDKYRDFIPWVSLDGFNPAGSEGYLIEARGSVLGIQAPGGSGNTAYLETKAPWYDLIESGKKLVVEFVIQNLYQIDNQTIWFHLTYAGTNPPTETEDHLGWKIDGADLYASNADGTTQSITDTGVNLSAGIQRTRLRIELNPGTNCKFYVDDVLKVTHTTNLPDASMHYLWLQVTTEHFLQRYVWINRVVIEKNY